MNIRDLISSSATTIFIKLSAGILGPHILLARVFGRDYIDCLRTHLRGLLEDASCSTRLHVWFQHNCAPPHYICEVRQLLFEKCTGRWFSRGREVPVFWPLRSPDLNPFIYFPQRYLETKVHGTKIYGIKQGFLTFFVPRTLLAVWWSLWTPSPNNIFKCIMKRVVLLCNDREKEHALLGNGRQTRQRYPGYL
jgi:hypothetical protein